MQRVMSKTPLGTIGGFRCNDNCIGMGVYGAGNCVTLEYNPETNALEILIRDDLIEAQNIGIYHVNENWEKK